VIDRAIARVKAAVDAALPHYQLTGELVKLKEEIIAELEHDHARVVLLPVGAEVLKIDPLVSRIEQIGSNAQAVALAKELEVVFPPEVKNFSAKVAFLLEHAKAKAAVVGVAWNTGDLERRMGPATRRTGVTRRVATVVVDVDRRVDTTDRRRATDERRSAVIETPPA